MPHDSGTHSPTAATLAESCTTLKFVINSAICDGAGETVKTGWLDVKQEEEKAVIQQEGDKMYNDNDVKPLKQDLTCILPFLVFLVSSKTGVAPAHSASNNSSR